MCKSACVCVCVCIYVCVSWARRVVGLGSGADTFIGQMYGAGRVGIIGVYAQVRT